MQVVNVIKDSKKVEVIIFAWQHVMQVEIIQCGSYSNSIMTDNNKCYAGRNYSVLTKFKGKSMNTA